MGLGRAWRSLALSFLFGDVVSLCRLRVRDGVPCVAETLWGGGGRDCLLPEKPGPFPSSPSVGSCEARGGWPVQLGPRLCPGAACLEPEAGPSPDSWLSSVVRPRRPLSHPRLSSRSRGPGHWASAGAGCWGGDPRGRSGRVGPQGEGSRGPPGALGHRAPPVTDRDTAFAQKVIQQVLDRIPLFAYKDLFIEPPLRGRPAIRACSRVYSDY